MRIISLNAWGGAMFDDLASWLDTCHADVLCLQEVTRTPTAGGWTRFDDADRSLPQRGDLMTDVGSRLPRHDGLFCASDSGPVRDDEGRVHRQDFGLAAFVSHAHPLVGIRASFVHGAYTEYQDRWPNEGRPRAALAVRVFDSRAGRFVTVVTVHGLRDGARTTRELPARLRARGRRTVRDSERARGLGPPCSPARAPVLNPASGATPRCP